MKTAAARSTDCGWAGGACGVRKPAPPTIELARVRERDPEVVRHRALLEAMTGIEFPYPAERFGGRGIVICGGGTKYFPCVYVLVRLLRHLGCALPVEVWHLGEREISQAMRALLAPHDVECVDAVARRRVHPARRLAGWELKCYALLHSRFAEMLLLDADNCPVRDPAFLFDLPEYRRRGAVFWPDFWRFRRADAVWAAAGLAPREAPQFESGQILLDKARCWRALHLAMHLNEHSEWWYRIVHGDKDTFQIAWRKIAQKFAMPPHPVRPLEGTMLQHDFAGRLLFQHRNFAKWKLDGNRRIPGFQWERECLGFLAELRGRWNELPPDVRRYAPEGKSANERAAAERLTGARWEYVRVGHDRRAMTFLPDGRIGEGAAGCEVYWDVRAESSGKARPGRLRLEVFAAEWRTFTVWKDGRGGWAGRWERFEGMPVKLLPASLPARTVRALPRRKSPAA